LDPAILITGLSFLYPDGHPALSEIDLSIEKDERVALVGPNGAGKSTLLLHLNGILTASQGKISIFGIELNKQNLGRIRSLVGQVFQQPDDQLFSPTVFEDVAYGPIYMGLPSSEIETRVKNALASVHMENYAQRVPFHLSTGEKKRISIATVLSMDSQILALDEPTAGLDPRARSDLIWLLEELDQTMLIATHDLDFARQTCGRTIVMDKGRIVADGSTSTILDDQQLLIEHGLVIQKKDHSHRFTSSG
jgi:cobalt/nickel transport system ATP-binding protein